MKKTTLIIISIFFRGIIVAQQMPVSENYFMDKSSLSSSYTGHYGAGCFNTGFRSDWTGIDGGPKTMRFSYCDTIAANAASGIKMIYDKAGIFNQIYLMGTYSYSIKISGEHKLLLALSAGIYHNKLNFTDYYNDPKYNIDPVMVRQDVSSKLKFMTDFSALYTFKGIEAGVMFANISFGDARYKDVDVTYKPFANYLVHASYSIRVNERWNINPLVYMRGGKYITSQIGIASMVSYQDNLSFSLSYRDPGILGFGIGTKISRGIKLFYNFNLSSSISPGIYNNHEISLGICIKELLKMKRQAETPESVN
jgi:type IX secretion system PorP/SprF family membrane protein